MASAKVLFKQGDSGCEGGLGIYIGLEWHKHHFNPQVGSLLCMSVTPSEYEWRDV